MGQNKMKINIEDSLSSLYIENSAHSSNPYPTSLSSVYKFRSSLAKKIGKARFRTFPIPSSPYITYIKSYPIL